MPRSNIAALLVALAGAAIFNGNDREVSAEDAEHERLLAEARERGARADRARREKREAEYRAVADQLQAERKARKAAAFAKRQPKA